MNSDVGEISGEAQIGHSGPLREAPEAIFSYSHFHFVFRGKEAKIKSKKKR